MKKQTGILILIICLLTSASKYVGNGLTEIRNELMTLVVHRESNDAGYTKTYIADRELSETEWNSLLTTGIHCKQRHRTGGSDSHGSQYFRCLCVRG